VLGGGPAGLGAAWKLRADRKAAVTLIEQNTRVGGNSGSFEIDGQRVDFGSHRLHPACDADVLADIRMMLGDDLLDRPRHGRIQLRNRWIHFPLKPLDLLLHLDRGFAAGTLRDMVHRSRYENGRGETFASVLWESLGPTICRDFYFPYARKIWGHEPNELSAIQAHRRVGAGSFRKLVRRVLSQVPGLKPPGAGRFYYPRRGYGQISEAYAERARADGAELMLGWRVTGLQHEADAWRVTVEQGSEQRTLHADYVWSTIPASLLPRIITPAAPADVVDATRAIDYRAMLLIYLTLDVERFTEYDAHYFPDTAVAITRLSEPKNYTDAGVPAGRTTLCAELPCAPDDARWGMSDAELAELVAADLARAGIPLPHRPVAITVRRLRHAYPIYRVGYEVPFGRIDDWVESVPRLLSFGRQGLFAHDNTHHALYMAYAAVDCLRGGSFDQAKWQEYRAVFATHVVED
jgi:protoporphyrinogen oxidase